MPPLVLAGKMPRPSAAVGAFWRATSKQQFIRDVTGASIPDATAASENKKCPICIGMVRSIPIPPATTHLQTDCGARSHRRGRRNHQDQRRARRTWSDERDYAMHSSPHRSPRSRHSPSRRRCTRRPLSRATNAPTDRTGSCVIPRYAARSAAAPCPGRRPAAPPAVP
jgi:hypothetical protein